MPCNAWNHASDCECGWGGQYHGAPNHQEIRYRSFSDASSYVNPNAICPICGARVFFYQGPNGGRVFFNDLGWPWPKHKCTDNPSIQSAQIRIIAPQREAPFRSRDGHVLNVYKLQGIIRCADRVFEIILKNCVGSGTLRVIVLNQGSESDSDFVDEIRNAPSFVIRKDDVGPGSSGTDSVEFISAIQGRVVKLPFQKPN